MRCVKLREMEGDMGICSFPTWFSGQSGLWVPESIFCTWGCDKVLSLERKGKGERAVWFTRGGGRGRKGSCSKGSIAELEMRFGIWIGKRGGRGEDLQPVCLLPWTEWLLNIQGMPAGARGWEIQQTDGGELGREGVHGLLELGQVGWSSCLLQSRGWECRIWLQGEEA